MAITFKEQELIEAAKEVGYNPGGNSFFGGKAINDTGFNKVQSLIDEGININVQDTEHGSTPLIHAIQSSNLKIANLLLNAGADINLPNRYGMCPLHMACLQKNDVILFLLEKGANYNLKTIDGISIIEWAEKNSLDGAADVIKTWKSKFKK